MKKRPSKVAHNQPPIFFSILPTGPKSAQISYFFNKNDYLRNFYIMTLIEGIFDRSFGISCCNSYHLSSPSCSNQIKTWRWKFAQKCQFSSNVSLCCQYFWTKIPLQRTGSQIDTVYCDCWFHVFDLWEDSCLDFCTVWTAKRCKIQIMNKIKS